MVGALICQCVVAVTIFILCRTIVHGCLRLKQVRLGDEYLHGGSIQMVQVPP